MLPRYHPRHRLKAWPLRRPFDPYLIAYWPCSEESGAILHDEGPHVHHGTWTPGTWGDGLLNKALLFDGLDDRVVVADDPIFDPGPEVTMELWLKHSVSQSYKYLFCHDLSQYKYLLYMTGLSGAFYWYIRTATGLKWVGWVPGSGYLSDGKWHHIVGTYKKPLLTLYYDAVIVGSTIGYDEDIAEGDEGIVMGGSDTLFFNGLMDDIHLYGRCLSAAEVLRHYLRLA